MDAREVQQFREVLAKSKTRFEERGSGGLTCKLGNYWDCSVLKLLRASWTNDRMDQVQNETGIFFSIWADEKANHNRAHYNIHALKLRQLKGYSITSRDFANEFRNNLVRDSWPNVSVDYGPLTLMQGWIDLHPKGPEEEILVLMERFKNVGPVIDRLLGCRLKKTRR